MAVIRKIKNDDITIYPITTAKAVYLDDGTTLFDNLFKKNIRDITFINYTKEIDDIRPNIKIHLDTNMPIGANENIYWNITFQNRTLFENLIQDLDLYAGSEAEITIGSTNIMYQQTGTLFGSQVIKDFTKLLSDEYYLKYYNYTPSEGIKAFRPILKDEPFNIQTEIQNIKNRIVRLENSNN